ncbi:MAG: hypothetical protein ACK5XS_10575 [Armatimonadota bacterium]|nr:hypothetical protein [Fimbriimonadaceae bacterium]
MDYITSYGHISGSKNHIRIAEFKFISDNDGLEFRIYQMKLKIGENEVSKWAPSDPEKRTKLENYYPVRFTASKLPSGYHWIEIICEFQVRRKNTADWSETRSISMRNQVNVVNFSLDWETVIDTVEEQNQAWWSYSSQARDAGIGQREALDQMGQRITMGIPTNVTPRIDAWFRSMTAWFPRTHGQRHSLSSSTTGVLTYEHIRNVRSAAVQEGAPRANMALLMASWTGRPLHDVLQGTPEFVNLGTGGILWSLAYPDTASDAVSVSPPHRPISELYAEAVRQMAAGRFANEIPALSEVASGSTYTGVYAKDPESDVYWWIPRNLEFFGDGNQRLGHVYMDAEQRMNFENRNADTRLWYLVLDPNDLRGE